MSTREYDVAVIGNWHLAFVTACVLADTGHKVGFINPCLTASDSKWTELPLCPVMEPHINEKNKLNHDRGLLGIENGVSKEWSAQYIWLAIDTPVNDRDEVDISPLQKVLEQIKDTQTRYEVLITNSQIPLGFSKQAQEMLGRPVCYIPENLRLGFGIDTFQRADRTVIGADDQATQQKITDLLKTFQTQFFYCNLPTAEMIKHANNAFLATSISFANQIAAIGETFGVDSHLVGKALQLDARIGKKAYVIPGLGFAGGTLPRDLRTLQKLGLQHGISTPLVDSVLNINEQTSDYICSTIQGLLQSSKEKRVLMLGYSYKADTDTLRRSLSLEIGKKLKNHGFQILGHDPIMNNKDLTEALSVLKHYDDLEDLNTAPDLILLMTGRPIFKQIDWPNLYQKWSSQQKRIFVFDALGFLDGSEVSEAGFQYKKIWSPEVNLNLKGL